MAKIVDPDLLNLGTELVLDYSTPSARTIRLVETGNLSSDGVTLQAVYSKLVILWNTETALPAIPFPATPITEEKLDLINNWDWFDDATRYLIRDGGWSVRNSSNVSQEEWACIVSLGTIGATDQVYFQQSDGGSPSNIQLQGAVNQAIKIYDVSPSFNARSYLKLFLREQGKTFAESSLTDIGVTSLDYRRYTFALANGTDSKIAANDTTVGSSAPYTGMSITYLPGVGFTTWANSTVYPANSVVQASTGRWFYTVAGGTSSGNSTNLAGGSDTGVTWVAYTGERQVGANYYAYDIIIDGNGGTAEQIYTFTQYQLRQNSDIDAGSGTVTGKTASLLTRFVGDTLYTYTGVFIDDYQSADINRLVLTDVGGTERTFPYTAAGTIEFSQTLQDDVDAKYWLYFTDPTGTSGDEFGTTGALLVDDADGIDITGSISGNDIISFTFAYDTNTQGGRTAGTDAAVTAVAIGKGTAQYISATSTLTRSTSNKIVLVAAQDRVYSNP